MSAPDQRCEAVPAVVVDVETAPGSAQFDVDERLRPERVELRSGAGISEALISVRLDNDFDAIDARQRYLPDLRLVIRSDEPDPAERVILFDGYPLIQQLQRDGRPGRRQDDHQIRASGVYSRLAQDRRAWIFGRRMRSGEILDALTAGRDGYASRTVHVEAAPCVFDMDGVGNRAADPISVVGADGRARRIFIFTYDGDPAAMRWTLLDAVRYLVWFHHLPEGPVSVRRILEETEAAAGIDPADRARYAPPSMLVERLLRPADEFNCEATNLVEALALAADQAGVRVTCFAENVGGHCHSSLRLWAAEDGREKSLSLAWGGRYADGTPRYDVGRLTTRDVVSDNQLSRVSVVWDHSSIASAPVVIGDVKRWEMTVRLVPGWLPQVDLDDVAPQDRAAAKAQALTPDQVEFLGDDAESVPWYRRYHSSGSQFAEYRDVARLWVLNEDGAYDSATYGRNPPFDVYAPFDFSTVGDPRVTSLGRWTRRPRPMQSAITPDGDGSSHGVFVEVSYDGGNSWHRPVGAVSVLDERAGIWFGLANPTAMVPPGGNWYDVNMWYALIDQVFRVRATALFDSDERVGARRAGESARTPTLWENSSLLYDPRLFRFASRRGTYDVLAAGDAGQVAFGIDDTPAAELTAARISARQRGGLIEAVVTIAWLDETLAIGDRIAGLRGRDISLNGVLRTAAAGAATWSVVGKTFDFSGGRFETALHLDRVVRV